MEKLLNNLKNNVLEEYRTFKENMVQKKPEEIYDAAHKIYFYKNMNGYIQDNEGINGRFVTLMHHRSDTLSELYKTYTYGTTDNAGINSWENIDRLINTYMDHIDRIM